MENDFIKLYDTIQPEIIEVKTEIRKVPKRITVIYELAIPKDEDFSKEDKKDITEDLSR